MAAAGWRQSITPSSFRSSGAQVAADESCFSGAMLPAAKPSKLFTSRSAPISASRSPNSMAVSSGPMTVSAFSNISPVSSPASIRMVVTPVTLSPLAMAH